jgi:hypothetical protein
MNPKERSDIVEYDTAPVDASRLEYLMLVNQRFV